MKSKNSMDKTIVKVHRLRKRRADRVRQHLRGDGAKPRMCVVKTNKHIQVQVVDDTNGLTLASISTNAKELRGTEFTKKNKASAKHLGEKIAEKLKGLGISQVIFDRGPFKYHGILAELATAVRAVGVQC
jgi:large subunit ribosomal protein L18